MPIREYQCPNCGHQWEELRRGQSHAEKCPECSGGNLIRPLAAPAVHFKGGGFWANDKHSYEPSKQVILRPDGNMDIERTTQVDKDWTPPGARNNRNRN